MIRNPLRIAVLTIAAFALMVAFSACGGSGGSKVLPPPLPPPQQAPSITTQPSAQTVTVGQSASFSVVASGTAPLNYQWRKDGANVQGATSAMFSIASVAMADAGAYTVMVSNSAGSATSSAAMLTVSQPPQAPTISAQDPTAILSGTGAAVSIDLAPTITGTAPITLSCQTGYGSCSVNGLNVTLSVPDGIPPSFSFLVTLGASNSTGSASANVTVNVQLPVPLIASIVPDTLSLDAEAIIGNIQIHGSGFYAGGVLHNSLLGDLVIPPGANPTQGFLAWGIGSDVWKPGWIDQSVSSPSGMPGGGTSPIKPVAFLGNQNTLARGATQVFQLEQGGTQHIRPFSLDGTVGTPIPAGNLGLDRAIGHDNLTSFAVVTQGRAIGVSKTDGGASPGVFLDPENDQMMGVAARNGWVCATQPAANKVVCGDLRPLDGFTQPGPLLELPVLGEPWNIAMTSLQNELIAIVWSRQDRMLTLVNVDPSGLTLKRATAIGGLFQGGQGIDPGRWQLSIFESGPLAGHIALLSQSDNTLVLVNISADPIMEVRRVTAPARSFRIGADETNGRVVVAIADADNRKTDFISVDAAGTMTTLNVTSTLLCTGFGVSADGTKLYCANRDQFQILNNN